MIDAHCHMEFMRDPDEVANEAKRRGMEAIVTSIADRKHNDNILALRERHRDFVFVCMGLHPAEVEYGDSDVDAQIDSIRENAGNIVAIGEVGLDYHHVKDDAKRENTREIFSRFIETANSSKKPLVIHSRDAMEDTLKALEPAKVPVMLHCFAGNREEMQEAVARGYFVSFTTLTPRNKKLRKLAKQCPLENMLLETDAPWLDPDPEAAKAADPFDLTNRPWKIELTAEKIAGDRNIGKAEIIAATANNAKKLFRI